MELVNRKRLLHTIRAYCIFRRCSIRFFPLLYTVWYLSITLYGYHTYGKVRFPREKQPFPLKETRISRKGTGVSFKGNERFASGNFRFASWKRK